MNKTVSAALKESPSSGRERKKTAQVMRADRK